jgi:acyl carrier protein
MNEATFMERIEEALRAEPGSIAMSDALHNLDGWDSIGALSVIAVIDEQFGVTLDAGDLMACKTVGALASLVAADVAKAA